MTTSASHSNTDTKHQKVEKVIEIEIDGKKYDLASNGQAWLITKDERDIYENPIARPVNLSDWIEVGFDQSTEFTYIEQSGIRKVQGLLDLLVYYAKALREARESKLRTASKGEE